MSHYAYLRGLQGNDGGDGGGTEGGGTEGDTDKGVGDFFSQLFSWISVVVVYLWDAIKLLFTDASALRIEQIVALVIALLVIIFILCSCWCCFSCIIKGGCAICKCGICCVKCLGNCCCKKKEKARGR